MEDKKQNYYRILQVSPNASISEIKSAYRQLAMKYHPDRNPHNRREAEKYFRLLNEAYTKLYKLNQRKQYKLIMRKKLKPSVANDNTGSSLWSNLGSCIREVLWPIADNENHGA
jgi:curved DNA-binding protein CbpA